MIVGRPTPWLLAIGGEYLLIYWKGINMDRGFISLHRKILDNSISKKPELFSLFVYLILKASHKKLRFVFNGAEQVINRGEFISGRKKIAEHFDLTENKIWRHLQTLQRLGLILLKSNNRFSIITIVKYSIYQEVRVKLDNKSTTNRQQVDTYNNNNNNNNIIKKRESAPTIFLKPILKEIIEYWNINQLKGGSNEAEKFYNYYESNGWRVGRSPMKNWKAAVRNWQQRMKEYSKPILANNGQYVNNTRPRRCSSCNNYLTSDGICYVPECSSNKIQESIQKILEG